MRHNRTLKSEYELWNFYILLKVRTVKYRLNEKDLGVFGAIEYHTARTSLIRVPKNYAIMEQWKNN